MTLRRSAKKRSPRGRSLLPFVIAVACWAAIAGAAPPAFAAGPPAPPGRGGASTLTGAPAWRPGGQPVAPLERHGAEPADFVAVVLGEVLPDADPQSNFPGIVTAPLVLFGLVLGWAMLCTDEAPTTEAGAD